MNNAYFLTKLCFNIYNDFLFYNYFVLVIIHKKNITKIHIQDSLKSFFLFLTKPSSYKKSKKDNCKNLLFNKLFFLKISNRAKKQLLILYPLL